jgi:AcrR family transcriptional regulator
MARSAQRRGEGADAAKRTDGAKRLPGGRHGLPPELVSQYQRSRLLEAMVDCCAQKGYERVAVADVLGAAGVSRATFYKLFEGKLDCFLAAYDAELDAAIAEIQRAYEAEGEWAARVRAGLAATLAWLAAHPAAARVLLIEVAAAGPGAKRRYRTALQRLTPFLEDGYDASELGPRLSPHTARMAIGSAAALVVDELVAGRGERLPELLPELVFSALVPFVGPREASERMSLAAAYV